jgi:hypothetical protein
LVVAWGGAAKVEAIACVLELVGIGAFVGTALALVAVEELKMFANGEEADYVHVVEETASLQSWHLVYGLVYYHFDVIFSAASCPLVRLLEVVV